MTVTVNHAKTNAISDWTQAQLDEQIALGNFPSGTTLANIVLPSDWNNDHTLTGLGTMAEQDATAVAITGGTINNTTIGATTATTGKFTSVTTPSVTATTLDLTLNSVSTGSVNFSSAGGQLFKISDGGAYGGYWNAFSASGSPSLRAIGNVSGAIDTNSAVPIQFRTNLGSSGAEQFRVGHTASAVNYVQVTGAATGIGNTPLISAQGSDATVNLSLSAKGGGDVIFFQNGVGTPRILTLSTVGAAVNYFNITPSTTNTAPKLSPIGTDTNISMAFQPKGTGAIDLAAGSSGVNISNGGTVTAITRTNQGSGYTGVPSLAISAPTTAGGVQATATCQAVSIGATPVSGGTGYTVGNTLTVTGLSGTNQITVTTVSSGAITGATITGVGYTSVPTNPASVTGGSGSGATFNLTYQVGSTFTITNAGSGYIEQPTITFSGGGSSGAAAYATVGSGTTIKNLGNITTFATPNSNVLAIVDKNSSSGVPSNTTVAFSMLPNQSNFASNFFGSSAPLYFGTTSSSTTDAFNFATSVGSPVSNGSGGSSQFRIVHTASAVNYVQVTGGATGTPATVTISGQGSSANIDLALTPKGTGLVKFGTYVAGVLLATGYINIKAADGTTYKVLVST